MKRILILGILTVIVCSYQGKPKFRYLNRGIPVYLSAIGVMEDSADEVMVFFKRDMQKVRCNLVTKKEYDQILDQNNTFTKSRLAKSMSTVPDGQGFTANSTMAKRMNAAFQDQSPVQTLRIRYVSISGSVPEFATCDSVGFLYKISPGTKNDFVRQMWSMDEIGSRSADTIAAFLIKQL